MTCLCLLVLFLIRVASHRPDHHFSGVKRHADIQNDLFEGATEQIKRLNKQARREQRQKQREQYARDKGLKRGLREG
jgi:hypothetical protein